MPSPREPQRDPDSGRTRPARWNWIGMAAPLLVAMLAPVSAPAGEVILSDVTLTARATFSSQRVTPEKSDFEPGTLTLQGVGLGGLVAICLRRRKAAPRKGTFDYARLRSRYPLATFSSISPSAWRSASSSLASSLVLAWPSLPIRP